MKYLEFSKECRSFEVTLIKCDTIFAVTVAVVCWLWQRGWAWKAVYLVAGRPPAGAGSSLCEVPASCAAVSLSSPVTLCVSEVADHPNRLRSFCKNTNFLAPNKTTQDKVTICELRTMCSQLMCKLECLIAGRKPDLLISIHVLPGLWASLW